MPRKNNPKQTVQNILSAAGKLFLEKGYDQTSMQDIVNELGMSKGAIFHHFKSKEEIFNAVMEKQLEYATRMVREWLDELSGVSGREKLRIIVERNIRDMQTHTFDEVMAVRMQDPRFMLFMIRENIKTSAPIIAQLIREGIADGSICTEFPDECAEIALLLANLWCDHTIFKCDMQQLRKRFLFLQHTLKVLGVDIISDEIINEIAQNTINFYGDAK